MPRTITEIPTWLTDTPTTQEPFPEKTQDDDGLLIGEIPLAFRLLLAAYARYYQEKNTPKTTRADGAVWVVDSDYDAPTIDDSTGFFINPHANSIQAQTLKVGDDGVAYPLRVSPSRTTTAPNELVVGQIYELRFRNNLWWVIGDGEPTNNIEAIADNIEALEGGKTQDFNYRSFQQNRIPDGSSFDEESRAFTSSGLHLRGGSLLLALGALPDNPEDTAMLQAQLKPLDPSRIGSTLTSYALTAIRKWKVAADGEGDAVGDFLPVLDRVIAKRIE